MWFSRNRKGSDMESRKKELPSHTSIETVKSGDGHGRTGTGHIVTHSYDNSRSGESYRQPEKHVFADHDAMMAHVSSTTGGKANGGANAGKPKGDFKPKGTPQLGASPKAAKAPGPKTHGAGVD